MHISLTPQLPSRVVLPASKSISARALIVNELAELPCMLSNLSDCDDTKAMLRALDGDTELVDVGAAGTAMRFLSAYYSTRVGKEHLLTGTERMKHRPIGILVEALRQLGADIEYVGEPGFPPLRIRGRKLRGGTLSIKADVSSQYISALLMLGPLLEQGLELHLEGTIASRPYIEMTLRLMETFGAVTAFEGSTISVRPGSYQRFEPMVVEPDWSAASYWFELVALSPAPDAHVFLEGLKPGFPNSSAQSLQGDSICAEYFRLLGVETTFTPSGAMLTKASATAEAAVPLCLDFSGCPDLAQTFVVTAALQNRPFRFTGLQSLKIKETDRIAALIAEAAKLGKMLYESAEGELAYDGPTAAEQGSAAAEQGITAAEQSSAATISIATYEDHRMAMAFAPAAYLFPDLYIEHPEVVSKSYPDFWESLPIQSPPASSSQPFPSSALPF